VRGFTGGCRTAEERFHQDKFYPTDLRSAVPERSGATAERSDATAARSDATA
jgi:hypothetical protein